MIGPLSPHLSGARVSAFIDGELDAEEAHRWRVHMQDCAACSSFVATERDVRARMQNALSGTPAPPSHLVSSLSSLCGRQLETVPPEPSTRQPARRLQVGVAVVTSTAAAAAVFGLAINAGIPGAPVPQAVPSTPTSVLPAAVPVPGALERGTGVGAGFGPLRLNFAESGTGQTAGSAGTWSGTSADPTAPPVPWRTTAATATATSTVSTGSGSGHSGPGTPVTPTP